MAHAMCCSVFGLLLQHATSFPEISREFSTSVLPSLISTLIDSQAGVSVVAKGNLMLTHRKGNANLSHNWIQVKLATKLLNGSLT